MPYILMVKQFIAISLNCSQNSMSYYIRGNDFLRNSNSTILNLGLGYPQIEHNQNLLTDTAIFGVNATQISTTNVHLVMKSQC